MRTLHFYFGRELLKTFLMTSAALSLLIIMGGGIGNIFTSEGIGAEGLAKILLYLAPIAVTLILPVAALFSATITYGRAATDNEVLACRAAGINIHWLLVPPLVLGLLVTIFTYFSWNYLVPSLMWGINEFTRRDLPTIVTGQFQKGKPLTYGKYRIMANQCRTLGPDDFPEDAVSETSADYWKNNTLMQLTGVSFLEFQNHELVRFGTADHTLIEFNHSGSTPRVKTDLQRVRSFDAVHRQYYEFEHQILGPWEIPLPIRRKIKFENLDMLLEFKHNPMAIPEMEDLMHGMRREIMVFFLNQHIEEQMAKGRPYILKGRVRQSDFQLEISAKEYRADENDCRLRNVRVRKTTVPGEPAQVYTSDNALIELRKGMRTNQHVIAVELSDNVQIRNEPAGRDDRVVKKPRETLPRVSFSDQVELNRRFTSFDIVDLIKGDSTLPLYPKQEKTRQKLTKKFDEYNAEVQGEIHFRASYSLVAIAIIVIGAVLGIIVRGGQVLTAFGISCVPMLFVIVASIVGRNLSDRPEFASVSLIVMWGATAFMYLATTFVAVRILKR
ncbi:MAG: LptF/LptG family permease [Phycisphaerales bacterium]|nr:LptF/LptG family permease [Phycisphaerales bacterium]